MLLIFLLPLACSHARAGTLVIVGGGAVGPEILTETLRLAGGAEQARIAILPQASGLPDAGEKSAAVWREAGAADIRVVDLAQSVEARKHLERANLVWMPGGQQSRLVEALRAAEMIPVLRARLAGGAVIGGTSAGAAAMSQIMIEGTGDAGGISAGAVKISEGLGLLPGVIVDQHFFKRQRFNRLLAAVREHPGRTGAGIDEGTALIVTDREWRVAGVSHVLILRADGSSGWNMRLLAAGDTMPAP